MARKAIRAVEQAGHVSNLDKQRKQHKARNQAHVMRGQGGNNGFAGKKFDELNNPAKDALLKAIALELELIEPDDD